MYLVEGFSRKVTTEHLVNKIKNYDNEVAILFSDNTALAYKDLGFEGHCVQLEVNKVVTKENFIILRDTILKLCKEGYNLIAVDAVIDSSVEQDLVDLEELINVTGDLTLFITKVSSTQEVTLTHYSTSIDD